MSKESLFKDIENVVCIFAREKPVKGMELEYLRQAPRVLELYDDAVSINSSYSDPELIEILLQKIFAELDRLL